MAVKVAINGFGRIGRLTLRSAMSDPGIEFVLAAHASGSPFHSKHHSQSRPMFVSALFRSCGVQMRVLVVLEAFTLGP